MPGIHFKFLKEMKNTSTGASTWSGYGTSPTVTIEDISVTTKAEYMVVKYGVTPKITPFGVKGDGGRVALLTGFFTARSMTYQANMGGYLDVLQSGVTEPMGLGLTLADNDSYALLPELGIPGECKWAIDSFTWDRAAIKCGQWKFSAQLSYIWDPTKNEIQLYANGIGSSIPESVQFAVTAFPNNTFESGTIVIDPKITVTVDDLNRATFKTTTAVFDIDDWIRIYCETDIHAVFFGVVEEIEKGNDGTVEYTCSEIGTLLQRIACAKVGAGLFKPKIKIKNPYAPDKYYKLKEMIELIMARYDENDISGFHPGYGADKTGEWGNKDVIPVTSQKIPAQILSGMSIFGALSNLLKEQCGMYIWFDNDNGKMEYGFIRNEKGLTIDVTKEYIRDTKQVSSLTDDFKADYVILYDSQGYWATSTDGGCTGTYIAYSMDTTLGDLQLKQMAKRIYSDMQVSRDTFKVTFPPGTVRFQDGDVFNCLGDYTSDPKLPLREGYDEDPTENPGDSAWQIKSMEITDKYTTCIVGSSYYSVFDVFKNQLHRVGKAPVLTEEKNIETNPRVVTKPITIETTVDTGGLL